ncbi:hypothetical protein I5Q07_14050, partial [Serratia ureilytica]|nr:hypothetical protein [Serratia ureilytica]
PPGPPPAVRLAGRGFRYYVPPPPPGPPPPPPPPFSMEQARQAAATGRTPSVWQIA